MNRLREHREFLFTLGVLFLLHVAFARLLPLGQREAIYYEATREGYFWSFFQSVTLWPIGWLISPNEGHLLNLRLLAICGHFFTLWGLYLFALNAVPRPKFALLVVRIYALFPLSWMMGSHFLPQSLWAGLILWSAFFAQLALLKQNRLAWGGLFITCWLAQTLATLGWQFWLALFCWLLFAPERRKKLNRYLLLSIFFFSSVLVKLIFPFGFSDPWSLPLYPSVFPSWAGFPVTLFLGVSPLFLFASLAILPKLFQTKQTQQSVVEQANLQWGAWIFFTALLYYWGYSLFTHLPLTGLCLLAPWAAFLAALYCCQGEERTHFYLLQKRDFLKVAFAVVLLIDLAMAYPALMPLDLLPPTWIDAKANGESTLIAFERLGWQETAETIQTRKQNSNGLWNADPELLPRLLYYLPKPNKVTPLQTLLEWQNLLWVSSHATPPSSLLKEFQFIAQPPLVIAGPRGPQRILYYFTLSKKPQPQP